jgi:nitrogen fixation/metabolism regulation signal transduction histidine kinase
MTFNNFNLRIILYAVLITLTAMAFSWSLYQPYMVATSTGLGFLLVFETMGMITHNRKIKKDLVRFTDAIKYQDTSLTFPRETRDPFMKELYRGFNEIITDFRLVKKEKETEHHFFRNTIQHVGVGLMAFNGEGAILLHNKALLELFNLSRLRHIKSLAHQHKDLPDLLPSLKNGEETLLKMGTNNQIRSISLRISDIKLEGESIRICSFKDVSREINRSEVEAWQKLIRVLRHEMMNSISPIRIMSGNLLQKVYTQQERPAGEDKLTDGFIRDLEEGLQTIRKRSTGLSEFVEAYRHLTKMPQPRFTEIPVKDLFEQIIRLFEKESSKQAIKTEILVQPDNLRIAGDEKMIEQVLINLVKNALESFDDGKRGNIRLKAAMADNLVSITVSDDGAGIPSEHLDNIFIPFYTTKEHGSGIGLSLSRQIIHLHNGTMQIRSMKGEGTTVEITL